MNNDNIEQSITASNNAHVGNISLIGKIVNVVKNPAQWQDTVFKFLSNHRYFFLVTTGLQIALLAIYLRYRGLHEIGWGLWAVTTLSFEIATWTGYTYVRFMQSPTRLYIACICGLLTIGIIGQQGWLIVYPTTFSPDVFGIAVANLKGSPIEQFFGQTTDFSEQIFEYLCREIDQTQEFVDADTCVSKDGERSNPIMIRRIGIIQDTSKADSYGKKIGAEIVIWGQVLEQNNRVTIRFEILETLDQVNNPDFPVVLPVTNTSVEITINELDLENDPTSAKKTIAAQAIVISHFSLGLAAYFDQNFQQALVELEQAEETIRNARELNALNIPNEGLSLLYYYLGKIYHVMGQIPKGQGYLQQANEILCEDPLPSNNSETSSLDHLQKPQACGEPAIAISLALGHGSLGEKDDLNEQLNGAEVWLKEWLTEHPDDDRATYDLALIYYIRDDYKTATTIFRELLNNNPNFFVGYLQIGLAESKQEQTKEAVSWLCEAIAHSTESNTNAAWAYLYLGLVYEETTEAPAKSCDNEEVAPTTLAKRAYQQALALEPDVDTIYFFYGHFLENQQEMDAALEIFQKMTEISHKQGWAFAELGNFLQRRGLLEQALQNYEIAAYKNNDDPILLTQIATTYLAMGNQEEARVYFEEALALNETTPIYFVYAEYAGFLFQMQEYEQAVEMYEKSLALRPDDCPVLLNLGQVLENLGQFENAAARYEQTLETQCSQNLLDTATERLQNLESQMGE